MPPFKRGEKITDPAILERLAKARAKALEVRQNNKKAKDDEKLVITMEKKQKAQEVQNKLDAMAKPPENKPLEKVEAEVKKVEVEESEPEEEEIVVVKKKNVNPRKKLYTSPHQIPIQT